MLLTAGVVRIVGKGCVDESIDQRVGIEDFLDRGSPASGGEVGAVFKGGEDGYVMVSARRHERLANVRPTARDIDVGVEFTLGL